MNININKMDNYKDHSVFGNQSNKTEISFLTASRPPPCNTNLLSHAFSIAYPHTGGGTFSCNATTQMVPKSRAATEAHMQISEIPEHINRKSGAQ